MYVHTHTWILNHSYVYVSVSHYLFHSLSTPARNFCGLLPPFCPSLPLFQLISIQLAWNVSPHAVFTQVLTRHQNLILYTHIKFNLSSYSEVFPQTEGNQNHLHPISGAAEQEC